MTGRLDGKRAVVAGGAGGIGSAISRRFIEEGADVIVLDIGEDPGPPASYRHVDLTSEDQLHDAAAWAGRKWDRLDILVNSAGMEIEKSIENTSLEEWNRIFAVNVTAIFLACREFLALLKQSGTASIINLGSYDGFIADPALAAYCATKGAVHALTRAMACDHGPQGIRVNAICPGYVDTPMLQSFLGDSGDTKSLREEIHGIHPTGTMGQPEDIANLALWLASDEARYASGQLWVMDGGLTAQVQQMASPGDAT